MPTIYLVDLSTGSVLNGTQLKVGDQFQWTTSQSVQNIVVHTPNAASSKWFDPEPTPSFNGPGNSVTLTARMTSPGTGWSYYADGFVVPLAARVHVQASKPHAKAS